jgi:hypothetical protein
MKSMLKIGSVLLFASAVFAQGPHGRGGPGFGPGWGFVAAGPASRTPVTGAPYSAVQTTEFQQTLAGGNQITKTQQTKVYRDSQGRVRMERSFTRPGATTAQTSISIFDPVAGSVAELNPSDMTAVTMSLPPHNLARSGEVRANRQHGANANMQKQTESLGTQTVNGVTATGTRITETIAAGAIGNAQPIQVVREVWESADLKTPVQIKSTDPRFGTTVMNLTNIVQSEPDGSLFVVPSTYTLKSRGDSHGFGGGPRSMNRRSNQ